MISRIAVVVYGKVQGVFFRKHTHEKALDLGLKGYVKNQPDGSVFIEVEGERERLSAFIEWCKTGSPRAEVSGINVTEIPMRHDADFIILR